MRHTILKMRYTSNRYWLALFLLMPFYLLLFTSCNNEELDVYVESENYRNVVDFAANNYNLSLFHAAIEQAGLSDELRGEGPFTVFAPSDQAFNNRGIVRASDFAQMDRDSLRMILHYHILPRRLYGTDVPDRTIDNRYENIAGKNLYLGYLKVNPTSGVTVDELFVNGVLAPKATQNRQLANGVIHVLEEVLKYNGTVQEALESEPDFSLFTAALKRFGYWESLVTETPYTLLAPLNSAFDEAGITLTDIEAMNPEGYHGRLFGGYAIPNVHLFTSDWWVIKPAGTNVRIIDIPIETDPGYRIRLSPSIRRNPPGSMELVDPTGKVIKSSVNLSSGVRTNYEAENGIIHGMDRLLVLPEEAKK